MGWVCYSENKKNEKKRKHIFFFFFVKYYNTLYKNKQKILYRTTKICNT